MHRYGILVVLALVAGLLGWKLYDARKNAKPEVSAADLGAFAELETKLAPITEKLGPPKPGDWLDRHKEPGQTFKEYLEAQPVRRSKQLTTIYICLIGEFTPKQREVLDLTTEYMALYFDAPVKVRTTLPLDQVPASAKRVHPSWGDKQILTGHVLDRVLKPDRPADALAYLAFTAGDLWPGEGWNFVYGQASLSERVGVWSMYRNGDPAGGEEAFRLCLKRTIGTAAHETGHILTIQHCTVNECNMNGSNHREESDRKPLHPCPICLRKLCWNLQVEPVAYLSRLAEFCHRHGLKEDAEWYQKAARLLAD